MRPARGVSARTDTEQIGRELPLGPAGGLRHAGLMPVALITGLAIVTPMHSERASAQDLRIEHVTIVSPESARELPDADVTVHDGRIAAIAAASTVKNGRNRHEGFQTLDGRGLYLVPGCAGHGCSLEPTHRVPLLMPIRQDSTRGWRCAG